MTQSAVLEELRTLLREKGSTWREVRGGVALEFRDGCDALFVTEETFGELPVSGYGKPLDAARSIVNWFARLDRIRSQVLVGLRHHAARRRMVLERR